MQVRAYVLIEIQGGKTKEVVGAIRKLEGVVSADAVTGPYDAIVTVEGDTLYEIGGLVTTKIHPISGISRTVTCVTI